MLTVATPVRADSNRAEAKAEVTTTVSEEVLDGEVSSLSRARVNTDQVIHTMEEAIMAPKEAK